MNINTANTQAAFLKYIADGKDIEFLTERVHEHVLCSGWIETNEKAILKYIDGIVRVEDEVLVDTFIGKLRDRIPALHMGIKLSKFETKRAQIIASALITQILIDSDELIVDKRVEPVFDADGNKKFYTRLYLKFGGSKTKSLLKGIEVKPGVVYQKEVNGWKLNGPEKAFLRKVAAQPFVVSDVCNTDLLLKGYSLKEDWNTTMDKNGRPVQEDPILKKRRYKAYAGVIIDNVAAMPCFYLPMKYCGRNRMYYEAASLDGIRPQGKLWETLMIDAAVPFDLTEEDEEVLKHLIYVAIYGSATMDEANEEFCLEDLLTAQGADPMAADNEEEFGKAILMNKAAIALEQYAAGEESQYIFGYDFTNSGLLMAGVAFNSPEMMLAANIGGSTSIFDSHTEFGNGYGLDLTRKEIKKVHMPLMHGSALSTIAKVLNELLAEACPGDSMEFNEHDIAERNEKAYGKCVHNITDIADWGTKAVGNEQSTLRWTMPDGFSAASRAYIKSLPVQVHVITPNNKQGYTSHVIVSDMPWVEDKKGYPIYPNEMVVCGKLYQVESKKRGLFAGITHSNDAYMLRSIGHAVIDSGRPILFKHDDFMTSPSGYFVVKHAAKCTFQEMLFVNFYQEALNEIAANSPYAGLEAPQLVMDDECVNTIYHSENFLMP